MIDERKVKLLNYLYPTEEARKFMCNDFYIELAEVVPRRLCVTASDMTLAKRKENMQIVKAEIEKFIKLHPIYEKTILDIYREKNWKDILDDVVIGYVFFVTHTHYKFQFIDIFKSKGCITYSPLSIIDVI